MRVLHVTNAYPYEAHPIYGIFIKEQIDSLQGLGISNSVLFMNAQKDGKLAYVRALAKLVAKANKFDIIHCHHLLSALPVLTIKSLLKPKVVVSLMSDGENEILLPDNIVTKRFKSWAYRTVISKSDARIFKKEIPLALRNDPHSFHLPNGVNLSLFKPIDPVVAKRQLNLDPLKDYVLFVSLGNLHRPEKRYDRFKAVMDILKNKKGLQNLEELHLVSTPRDLVSYYFNAASLHLLTSDFEGSPNSVKEAMACNLPVVSTDVGNVRNIVEASPSCRVSRAGTPEELAELAFSVLTSVRPGSLREELISKNLDSMSVASTLSKIYEHTLHCEGTGS